MDAKIWDRVFEPFFTTKQVGEGSGLGLSMVYGFVHQSGGHIFFDSQQESGVTVTLILPRAKLENATEKQSAAPKAPDDSRPAAVEGKGETLLVVEDNEKSSLLPWLSCSRWDFRPLRPRMGWRLLNSSINTPPFI